MRFQYCELEAFKVLSKSKSLMINDGLLVETFLKQERRKELHKEQAIIKIKLLMIFIYFFKFLNVQFCSE